MTVVRLRKEDEDFSWTPYLRKQNRIFFSEFGMTIENYVMNIYHHVSALKYSQCNICSYINLCKMCIPSCLLIPIRLILYGYMQISLRNTQCIKNSYWFFCILKLKNVILSENSYVLSNLRACCYLNFWLDKEQFLFLWVIE